MLGSKRVTRLTAWIPGLLCVAFIAATAFDLHRAVAEDRYLWCVTIDGLRPEEVFAGADKRLIDKEIGGVEAVEHTLRKYWHADTEGRREKLLPFFWNLLAKQGQVFGSTEHECMVVVKNERYFSYPGYQEILCGFPDDAVDSNDKINNKNTSVLEWLASKPQYSNQVAAFTSWDVFPYILNTKRSGIDINAGWQEIEFAESQVAKNLINQSIRDLPHYWRGSRSDCITFQSAMQYLKVKQPSVLYLALDETDNWCHHGRYDLYLDAAHRSDQYLATLWEYAQSSEKYRNKTSLIVTTDHGRGNGREGWKSHGNELPGSERIWIALIGPATPAKGVRSAVQATQGQYAASAALLLGEDFTSLSPEIAPPLPGIVSSDRDRQLDSVDK